MGSFYACVGIVPEIGAQNEEDVKKCGNDGDCEAPCAFRNCPGAVNKCYGGWCVCCQNPPPSSSADHFNLNH